MNNIKKKKWYESWWFITIIVTIIIGQISKCSKEKCNDFEGIYRSECTLKSGVNGYLTLYINKECNAIYEESYVVLGVAEKSKPVMGKIQPVENRPNEYRFVGEGGENWSLILSGNNITVHWSTDSCIFYKES